MKPGAESDDAAASSWLGRSRSLLILGLSAYFLWQIAGMSPSLLSESVGRVVGSVNHVGIVDSCLFVALCAVVVASHRLFSELLLRRLKVHFAIAACVLMVFGVLAAALSGGGVTGSLQGALAVASRVPLPASVLFMLLWGDALCNACGLRVRDLFSCLAISHGIAFAGTLVLSLSPSPVQLLLYILLPVVSGIAFVACGSGASENVEKAPVRKGTSPVPLRLFLGLGLFGVLIAFLTFFSEEKTPEPDELYVIYAGLVVSVVFAVFALRGPKNLNLPLVSRTLLPLCIVCFFVIFAFDTNQPVVEVALIGGTWLWFRIYFWAMLCLASVRSPWPCISVLAAGQGVYSLCSMIGSGMLAALLQSQVSRFAIVGIIVVAAIVIATFLLNDRYIARFGDETAAPFDAKDAALCQFCVERARRQWDLTDREADICRLAIQGFDNVDIRNDLVIAQSTLSVHLRNIYRKAGVHSRRELEESLRSFALD